METICHLNNQIEMLDRELEELSNSNELMVRLRSVLGVGPVVSVVFMAWLDRSQSELAWVYGPMCEALAT